MKLITKTFRGISHIIMGGVVAFAVASCGGGGGSPGTVAGGSGSSNNNNNSSGSTSAGAISLIFSSSELKSAGTAGSEVTVTALVKSANNVAIPDMPVQITASSGVVTSAGTTDKNGKATALLGTGGDHTNRTITVTAQAGGQTATGTVNVVGTTVTVVGPGTVSSGGSGDFTITVKDSANVAVANVPVTFSSQKGNPIVVKTSGVGGSSTAPRTDSQGQVVLTLTASQSGNDVLSISSQGANAASTVNVNAAALSVGVLDSGGNSISEASTSTSCSRVAAHYTVSGVLQSGTVNITTSRGNLYSNSTCTVVLPSSSVPLTNGDSQAVYLKSDTAGVATVTASVGGLMAQANVEFIAPLTPSATISLQAEPAVIGANSGTGQSEKSTLTAIVRDSTTNNLIKNAVVEFAIVNDLSGGSLSNPSTVTTASNGSASVIFFAGTATTPTDGVTIQATIQGTTKSTTAKLTVAKKSLFISAGTGNKIGTPDNATYQLDYAVFVTDAAGNPVPGVTVTASVMPTRYAKGHFDYDPAAQVWMQDTATMYVCANEDVNRNGILDAGEDYNLDSALNPGIPASISSSGTTDANGIATISLRYPRDRAYWVEAQVIIHGSVSGTESTYQTSAFFFPGASTDYSDKKTAPPGQISPYGVNACNVAN